MPFENSSLFLFGPGDTPAHTGMVVTSLVWQGESYGERVKRIDAREIPTTELVPGYVAIRNRTTQFWVAEGSRIYPELPHVTLNFSQDLFDNLQEFFSHAHYWALAWFYASPHDDSPEIRNRVFVSLELANSEQALQGDGQVHERLGSDNRLTATSQVPERHHPQAEETSRDTQ